MNSKSLPEKSMNNRKSGIELINNRKLRTTADKRLRCYAPSPKMPSATSFIRETLSEILANLNRKLLHYENHGGVTTK